MSDSIFSFQLDSFEPWLIRPFWTEWQISFHMLSSLTLLPPLNFRGPVPSLRWISPFLLSPHVLFPSLFPIFSSLLVYLPPRVWVGCHGRSTSDLRWLAMWLLATFAWMITMISTRTSSRWIMPLPTWAFLWISTLLHWSMSTWLCLMVYTNGSSHYGASISLPGCASRLAAPWIEFWFWALLVHDICTSSSPWPLWRRTPEWILRGL